MGSLLDPAGHVQDPLRDGLRQLRRSMDSSAASRRRRAGLFPASDGPYPPVAGARYLPAVPTSGTAIFDISASTQRALTLPRPRTRGVSHLIAAVISLPAAVWLTASAPDGHATVAAGVFGLSMFAMFTASATVHRRRWSPRTTEILFRLDHTGILLAIAGTATPLALLALDGWERGLLLWGVWGGAALAAVVVWWPRPTPRGFLTAMGFLLGAIPAALLPTLYRHTGWTTIGLLLAGGAMFAVGAAIVGLRRPDPNPHVFGYHEIWHLLVVSGVGLYYVMVAGTLLPAAAAVT